MQNYKKDHVYIRQSLSPLIFIVYYVSVIAISRHNDSTQDLCFCVNENAYSFLILSLSVIWCVQKNVSVNEVII